uniref:Uncharacterized protein n=1 Tax=Anguilla anguilla TaxID=7936 RepID=A0A0E9WKJ0_ANGAN
MSLYNRLPWNYCLISAFVNLVGHEKIWKISFTALKKLSRAIKNRH